MWKILNISIVREISNLHVVIAIKNPPANAGDIRDAGSIPGSRPNPGSPEKEISTLSNILAWRIP